MTEQQIYEITALAQRKAHIESIRRLQVALEQELNSAGIHNFLNDSWKERYKNSLNDLNVAIGEAEWVVGNQYDDKLFKLTSEAAVIEESQKPRFIMKVQTENENEVVYRDFAGTKKELKKSFVELVCEWYELGLLHGVQIYAEETQNHAAWISFVDVQEFFDEDE